MVGVTGFEPATPASRRQCSTKLSYTPMDASVIASHREAGQLTEGLTEVAGGKRF